MMDPTVRTIRSRVQTGWEIWSPRLKRASIALVAAFAILHLTEKGVADAIEPSLLRAWFFFRGNRAIPQTVTIVRIDNPAYKKINLSPGELFPRNYMAEAVQKISDAGAKLIVIDGVPQRPGDDPDADTRLAAVLSTTPTVIGVGREMILERDVQGNEHRIHVQKKPFELFEKSAKEVVQLHLRLTGGVAREISLSNDRDVFSADRVPLLKPLREFIAANIPEPGGFDFINFYGPPSFIASLSMEKLIGPITNVPDEYFKDRVVFIGTMSDTNAGIESGKDSFLTPISHDSMFGVEIHATIAANLLDRSWCRRVPRAIEGVGQMILALCLSLAILTFSMYSAVMLAVGFVFAWLLFSYVAFAHYMLFVPAIVLCSEVMLVLITKWAMAAFAARRRS